MICLDGSKDPLHPIQTTLNSAYTLSAVINDPPFKSGCDWKLKHQVLSISWKWKNTDTGDVMKYVNESIVLHNVFFSLDPPIPATLGKYSIELLLKVRQENETYSFDGYTAGTHVDLKYPNFMEIVPQKLKAVIVGGKTRLVGKITYYYGIMNSTK